jgi:tetratricopeptide (TPR) repeat protein
VTSSGSNSGVPKGTPEGDPNALKTRVREDFFAGLGQLQNEQFEAAAESFAALEAILPPHWTTQVVMAKSRRAAAFIGMRRWDEALALFDELIADPEALRRFPRDRFPDEVATIYWGRPVCLEQLGRLDEACDAVPALIEEVGSGTTATQREYVGGIYLLQAKAAEANGQFDRALKAVDAAITHCSRTDDPQLKTLLQDATEMRVALQQKTSGLN